MAYQVLQSGAMLELVNGVGRDGREKTSMVIARENDIIEQEIGEDLRRRYDEGDEYVRSILLRGTVAVDDDGNKALVPDEGAAVDADESEVSKDAVSRAEAAEGELTAARTKITELEATATRFQEVYDAGQARISELQSELAEAQKAQAEAEEAATGGLSYGDLSKEALVAEAEKKGLTVTRAEGDGDPVKADYVRELEAARSSS